MQLPTGTGVVFDGGSFTGVLPSVVSFAGTVGGTSTGSGCSVTFKTGFTLASGGSITLVNGSLTIQAASIDGALSLDGVQTTCQTSLEVGGTFSWESASTLLLPSLTLTDGATLYFVDGSNISATTSASLTGTQTLNGAGYFALPSGTVVTGLTQGEDADVRVCYYGAGVTELTTGNAGDNLHVAATATKTDASKTILTEVYDEESESWTLLEAFEDSAQFQAELQGTTAGDETTVRVYDGAAFWESTYIFSPVTPPGETQHAWLVYVNVADVALGTANPYDVTIQTANPYQTTSEFIMASEYSYFGESIVLFARIQDSQTSLPLTEANVSSVKYTCYRVKTTWGTQTRTPVNGHNDVTIPTDVVKNALVTTDPRWTKDQTGYNVLYEPTTTQTPIFPEPGQYLIVLTITPTSGNPAPIHYEVTVK